MKKVFLSMLAIAASCSLMAGVTPHYEIEAGYDHGIAHMRQWISYYHQVSYFYDKAQMDGFHVGGNVQLDFSQGQHVPSLVLGLNYQFLTNNIGKQNSWERDILDLYVKTQEALGAKNIVATDYAYMHTLQIPVHFQYTYQINNDWRFLLYTGPQIRLHVAFNDTETKTSEFDGKKNGEYTVTDIVAHKVTTTTWVNGVSNTNTTETDALTPWVNCFDMSWGFGMGFGWKFASLKISYDLGMLNMFSKETINTAKRLNGNMVLNSDALAVTLGFRLD